jgi:glycosyltransferase involved in cell wall biosynthesis
MRILFITQGWQPESFLKGMPFAKELQKLGHTIEVLTGYPHYPQGKLYPGYRIRFLQRETMDGISVIRVPLYPSHDRSAIRRMATYFSYAFSASLIGPWVVKRADVAYVYQPPATVGLPACTLRLLRGIPFVYDIQDLWPDTLAATGMFNNRLGMKMVDIYCRGIYRLADKITVLSPGFKQILCSRGVPSEKIEVIYNWSDDTAIYPVERNEQEAVKLGLSGRFNIIFAGNMGKAQALGAVLKAAKIVAERFPKVQFVFAGGGVEVDALKREAGEMAISNTLFLPWRPREEVNQLLSLADVLLVHLKDDPLFRITIPSKIQAYMAAERPIIVGVSGDAAELITKAQAGLVCRPEDPESIAQAVCQMASMPPEKLREIGKNGRTFYEQELSLVIGARKFDKIFSAVANKYAGIPSEK